MGEVAHYWAQWVALWGHYWPYPTAAAAYLVARFARRVVQAAQGIYDRRRPRDPKRQYTTTERKRYAAMAGWRCEGTRAYLFRCHNTLEGAPEAQPRLLGKQATAHGDHHIPWARGGATTPENLVMLCARCNLRKGAKPPTWWQGAQIARRRRRYYPQALQGKPGMRYGEYTNNAYTTYQARNGGG